jgi:hypothetical protein
MKLHFDINAFCMVEELSGYASLNDILSNPSALSSIRMNRILIYAGLLHNKPELTLREAGEILQKEINKTSLKDVSNKISEAIEKSGLVEKKKGSLDGEEEADENPK